MDIGKNFTFVMEDEAWIKKVLIAGLGMLLFGLPTYGYVKRMFRNAVEGHEKPLPEWDDFVGCIVDGLKAFVVGFGYMIPTVIIVLVPTMITMFTIGRKTPAVMFLCQCGGLLIYMVAILFMHVGLMRFFATDNLMAAFQFGEIIGFLKNNIGQFLLAFVVFFATILAAEIVGLIACGIGVLFTIPYAMLVGWKNFADVYRNAQMQASPM